MYQPGLTGLTACGLALNLDVVATCAGCQFDLTAADVHGHDHERAWCPRCTEKLELARATGGRP